MLSVIDLIFLRWTFLEKGYSLVTMSDVGQKLHLSAGGLYYHYHSVEEILSDIVANETGDVWQLFEQVTDLNSLIIAFRKYFEIVKAALLNFANTLNSILYQYYFSFPAEIRKAKCKRTILMPWIKSCFHTA